MARYLLLFFFLIPVSLLAQRAATKNGVIKGTTVDSTTQKPLLEANISLLNARDSSFVQLQSTGGDGDFTLTGIAPGAYRLLISFVGYKTKTVLVSITTEKPEVSLGTLSVQPQAQNLGEVVIVQERPPVSVRGDTVAFNASSFKTQPNAQVEDLIKKLPGMEVDRDGNVKAQGQDVKRIFVDGKPFFGNDPKMATRNLPADMIDRVEVFDRQSDQSQFSGVDDGERDRTINLVTKRDRRRGVFGQEAVGYGTDDRYQARISVNRFNNGQQLSAIGQLNNINQQGFTGEGLGGGGGGQQGGNNRGGGGGQTGGLAPPSGITRAGAAGLNFSDALGTKIDLSSSYFFNQTNALNEQVSRRETSLPATTVGGERTQNFTDRSNGSMSLTNSHRFNVQFNYRMDSLNSIRVIPNFTYSLSNNNTNSMSKTVDQLNQPLNSSTSLFNSDGKSLSGNNTFLWMHKFKRRGRTFSANLITSVNDNTTNSLNQSQNQFFRSVSTGTNSSTLTGGGSGTVTGAGSATGVFATTVNQMNRQLTNALTNNMTLSYTEPLSLAKTLEFRYNLSVSNNESDRRTTDFNNETGQYDRLNTQLSNNFVNTFVTNRLGTSYQYRRVKYQYTLGFDMQNASLKSDNLSRDTTIAKSFQNILPNARFQYTIGRSTNFTVDYRTRVNAPSVTQLQPVIDNSNPLYIRSGNPNLRPEYTHSLNINYRTFDATTYKSFNASLGLTNTYNRIVNATTITPAGAQVSQPINTDGYYSLFAFTSFGKPVNWGAQKVNVNWTSSLNGSRGISFVNGQSNTSVNMNIGQGLSLNTNINEKTDLNLSGNVTYSIATYSIQPQQNTRYFTNIANLRAYHRFGNRFFLSTDVYYSGNTGRAAGYNQQFILLNGSVGQFLFKQKQGEWRITGYDLLNQNQSITRNTTETYIEDTNSLVLRRYFMLTFSYSIRYFAAMRATP
ncbi:outer membrane beta-barrel protein [uncultured Fibrella sp.]|uniref:outer membrane beta-barrel protein n=1 Tax=uncultured Fibrella sp. TaxID=1284596 RepID=UPI0035CA9E00